MNDLLQTLYYLETESNRLDFDRDPALQPARQALDLQFSALSRVSPSHCAPLQDAVIRYADLCGQRSFSHGFRLALRLFWEG